MAKGDMPNAVAGVGMNPSQVGAPPPTAMGQVGSAMGRGMQPISENMGQMGAGMGQPGSVGPSNFQQILMRMLMGGNGQMPFHMRPPMMGGPGMGPKPPMSMPQSNPMGGGGSGTSVSEDRNNPKAY